MQKVARYCDRLVGRGSNRPSCGERVPDDEPTTFTLQGVTYVMDLCEKHREELENLLSPWMAIAEPATIRRTSGAIARKAIRNNHGGMPFTLKDVREWAKNQPDIEVGASGQIKQAVIERYAESHGFADVSTS